MVLMRVLTAHAAPTTSTPTPSHMIIAEAEVAAATKTQRKPPEVAIAERSV